jgi:hypothetical protein
MDIIYDLGGWIDNRIIKVIEDVDLVIIPMINSNMGNKHHLIALIKLRIITKIFLL